MKVSVIIPTLNRFDSLYRAITSASNQTLPSDCYEIIVVDNGSTDETQELIEHLKKDGQKPIHKPIHYVFEPNLGLHNARHAGARVAKGDILVFTDDDATFDPSWLEAYSKTFIEHPEMVAAGGPVRPIWEAQPPKWLLDYMGDVRMFPILSIMEPYKEFRLDLKGFFFGVNMAIRRNVLLEVGGFNPEAFGDIWLGDGETGLNRKLWERGMLIGYVPEAIAYHNIPLERMTVKYFCRRMANEGACTEYELFHHGIPGPFGLFLRIAKISFSIMRLLLGTFVQIVIHHDKFAMLRTRMGFAYNLSRIRYVLCLLHDTQFRELVKRENWLTG